MTDQCHGRVSNGPRTVSFHRCYSTGTLEHDGKMWCKLHHPPTLEIKAKARHDRWADEYEARNKRLQADLLLMRKGKLFDEVWAMLNRVRHGSPGIHEIIKVIEKTEKELKS